MSHEIKTDVLIIGAGPVGLLTALVLAENRVAVTIIDQEPRTAGYSYACALHPRTLAVIEKLGLTTDVLEAGYRLNSIGLYSGEGREQEIALSAIDTMFPFLLVLPQDVLEAIFEHRLRMQKGIHVHWSHRLSDLRFEHNSVLASVDRYCHSAKGYGVPDMDWEVESNLRFRSAFVVGADGSDSMVRQCCGIPFERHGPAESFAVYEIACCENIEPEVRIVLDEASSNVIWPLGPRRCRWTLQLTDPGSHSGHKKDRSHVQFVDETAEDRIIHHVQMMIGDKAPWFLNTIEAVQWSTVVQFENGVAKRYGNDRCWLAGDSAHQTSPIGMQSMNVGLAEAWQLGGILSNIVLGQASHKLLDAYGEHWMSEWRRLHSVVDGNQNASAEFSAHSAVSPKLMRCLPASGEELTAITSKLCHLTGHEAVRA